MLPWNYRSAVTSCKTCEGTGTVYAIRRPTVNDPYPEDPCPHGCKEHEPECEVCGYTQETIGYDCLACDTIASLVDRDLARFDPEAFHKAIIIAVEKARS